MVMPEMLAMLALAKPERLCVHAGPAPDGVPPKPSVASPAKAAPLPRPFKTTVMPTH